MDGARQSLDERCRGAGGPRDAGDLVPQMPAGSEFQGKVGPALVLAYLVDLDELRVLQARDRFGFTAKPGQLLGAGVSSGQDHLQGDDAVEAELPGLVNYRHPAAAEPAEDFVAGNLR